MKDSDISSDMDSVQQQTHQQQCESEQEPEQEQDESEQREHDQEDKEQEEEEQQATTSKVNPEPSSSQTQTYSDEELSMLLEIVAENKTVLYGSFSNKITFKLKETTWKKVAESVNSVGGNRRGHTDVKRKWDGPVK